MEVPLKEQTAKLEVKKSLFVASVFPVHTREEIKGRIQLQRNEHPKCSHVVWAFVLGDENNQHLGMSDDGEPRGTAGRPVLQLLQYSEITNILVTVVRYFGGTKLGKGGLVKAYTDSAQAVLEGLQTKKLIAEARLKLTCSYKHYDAVKMAIERTGARIEQEQFEEKISITLAVAEESEQNLTRSILDSSNGEADITPIPS